jgi:prolipoprotein diacylglyceryl transferase
MMPASIPSPSQGTIDIGPLSLTAYGLFIALGVVVGVWMFGRRLEQRGVGTRDDAASIAVWGVLAGVIGARLYHVITDWEKFEDDLGKIPKIWEGGLGIPGGIILGMAVGLYCAHQRSMPLAYTVTCAAPAIPLAQAIGRWGNYFNQELYGRPTDLPWALEIDPDHFPPGRTYPVGTTFHPTFLYEMIWNLGLCGLLLYIDRGRRLAPGSLMGVYLVGYGVGRFWVEGLRIDEADHLAGLRWNQWMAVIFIVAGVVVFVLCQRQGPEGFAPVALGGDEAGRADEDGEDVDEDAGSDEPASSPDGDPLPSRTDAQPRDAGED